jgi:hypothetical protein
VMNKRSHLHGFTYVKDAEVQPTKDANGRTAVPFCERYTE